MRKRWIVKKADKNLLDTLVRELNISPIMAQLLINRSISSPDEADEFLNCRISSLHDPYLLRGMEGAVERVRRAISRGEKIMVYGDYDVDGITSVALLSSLFTGMGGHVIQYIPNRLEEGYGLNLEACRYAHTKKVSLLVTVDCGISAEREVDYLNRLGVDTIIVDHHEVQGDSLPKAYAVIDPHQRDCRYPFKYLAGVGLAFKLAQALDGSSPQRLEDLLDLVALGTVSDVAPQLGENRILTKYGLEVISRTRRPGLKELINVSGLKGKDISSGHIGYILGPRINASGRLGSPKTALKLLLTDSESEARELAGILDRENKNRQRIESDILKEAIGKVQKEVNFKEDKSIVLASDSWHTGVIGIVASRLVDRFYRPSALISVNNRGIGHGSARSISDFNLFEAIGRCGRHLIEFGGHEAACGFRIEKKKIGAFKEAFNETAKEMLLPEHLLPKLDADMDIPLNRLSENLIADIERLAPHGPKNPSPVFISREILLKNAPRAIGRNGAKFWVTDGKITCEAVVFGVSDAFYNMLKAGKVDLAYSPSMNSYKGVSSIQLTLKDLRAGPVSNGASEKGAS